MTCASLSCARSPLLTLFINAGVYLLEPAACDHIPDGIHFDMTDLIKALLDKGRTVVSFPIVEYWRDLGRLEDYRQAQEDVDSKRSDGRGDRRMLETDTESTSGLRPRDA